MSKSRFQSLSICLVFLFFVYGNLATVLRNPSISGKCKLLPVPSPVYRSLVMYGVFSNFSTNNTESTIWGLTEGSGTNEGFWKQLPTDDFFPFRRAEQRKRLWTSRHQKEFSAAERHDVWRGLGIKILNRYNREHPSTPIVAVALQSVSWPSSPDGFYARQAESIGKRQFWIVAEKVHE